MPSQGTKRYLWLDEDCAVAASVLQCCGSAHSVLNLVTDNFFFQIAVQYGGAHWYLFRDGDGIASPCLGSTEFSTQGCDSGSTLRLI